MPMLQNLSSSFRSHADPQRAVAMAAYMRDQFSFFGIAKPLRAELQKEVFTAHPLATTAQLHDTLLALWHQPQREYLYTALDLAYKYKRLWQPDSIELFKDLIEHYSWWDTVDIIAAKLLGTLVLRHKELQVICDEWIDDDNLWVRRAALLHQLHYKEKTDTERLFAYCTRRMHEQEFFVRKAIGWALRSYAKTAPEAVATFLAQHRSELAPLSYREASKHL